MSIGVHVAKVSKVLPNPYKNRKTIIDAITVDCNELNLGCCQIFVAGPRSSKMNYMDYTKIKKYIDKNKINIYVHSNYIAIGIFSVDKSNKETPKSKKIIKNIINQMDACDKLGSNGFVIHLSKRTPDQIVETLKILYQNIKHFKTPLLLEQPAKKPDDQMTYETPEKINNLTKLINKKIPKLIWGWCIDTAHLFAAGVEVDEYKVMNKWFVDLKYTSYIKLFHINGMSIDQFNTGKDTHQVVFGDDDDIWNADFHIDNINIKSLKKSSICLITQFAKKNNVDCICEINRGEYNQIKFSINSLRTLL